MKLLDAQFLWSSVAPDRPLFFFLIPNVCVYICVARCIDHTPPPLGVASLKKKDGDLSAAVSRASALEGQLNQSEAALATALSQNTALIAELGDVKSMLAKV